MHDAIEKTKAKRVVVNIVKLAVALVVIAGGVAVALYFIKTAPKVARRGGAIPEHTLVRTVELKPQNYQVVIDAMGTVVPDEEVIIQPRVTGEVTFIHPRCLPGGFFDKGQKIIQIDPKDYEITLRERQSDVVQINKDIKVEMGLQEIARREYESLKQDGFEFSEEELELVLRRPQMKFVEAKLASAQAALERAKLNLERTSIYAPFNGQVLQGNVEFGSQVNPQTNLLTLVGTDAYWIELTVEVSQLKWIKIPAKQSDEKGASVKVFNKTGWGENIFHDGHIIKLEPALESQGRMARLLASVRDPLGLTKANKVKPTLLLDMFVSLQIQGTELENVYVVPRSALHDGRNIWLADSEDKLRIRQVECVFKDRDTVVLADGIEAGDRLIISDIAAPVEGMKLKLQ